MKRNQAQAQTDDPRQMAYQAGPLSELFNEPDQEALEPTSEPAPAIKPVKFSTCREFKLVALRECPTPEDMALCDDPAKAAAYWREHVVTGPSYNSECECFVVLMLNVRKRIVGHVLVATGTMDTIMVHPREVFRAAISASAHSIILMHNNPSGESSPSEADIKVTRDLIRGGQLLQIQVNDHVIVGNQQHTSLRELGYFYV